MLALSLRWSVVVVRLGFGTVLIERQRVSEGANARARRRERTTLWYESDRARGIPVKSKQVNIRLHDVE